MQDDELLDVCCKYPRFVRDVLNCRVQEPLYGVDLRDWQETLLTVLQGDPHPRHIYWVWENEGNVGKSWFATYLSKNHDACVLTNGKTADIAHAYEGQRIAAWDLSRSQETHINYAPMEDLKNGRIFSPKYDSQVKYFDVPHVVVFANFNCPKEKFSDDRIVSLNLRDERMNITEVHPRVYECVVEHTQINII